MERNKETILYRKVGKRYFPWGVGYDRMDSYPIGSHLLVVSGGQHGAHITSYYYNINPDFGPILAAARLSSEKITDIIQAASAARPRDPPSTQEQQDAWEHLKSTYGGGPFFMQYPSYAELAMRIVEGLIEAVSQAPPPSHTK